MAASHIAVIPARRNSKGFPFKNRKFFDATADFIDRQGWFASVIVSTDDERLVAMAEARGYRVRPRPAELAGDAVSIKPVFRDLIERMAVSPDAFLWLFYLPNVYKDPADFVRARELVEREGARSVAGFVPALTHPYNCWSYDEKKRRLEQFVPNDVFRRQDLPPAWMLHHYVCCFQARELESLNDELVGAATLPLFLSERTVERLIEIDTPEDYERWQRVVKEVGYEG